MGSEFLTSDGIKIEYEYVNHCDVNDEATSVVFLNGIFMHYESWKVFSKNIPKNIPVLFHNFRCQWGSGCAVDEECSFERHVEDLKELLDYLGIKKAKFIGTSYGGEVGMLFGAKYPEYVESMMIITSTARIDNVMKSKALRWKDGAKSRNSEIFVNSWLSDVYSELYINSVGNLSQIIASRLTGFNYEGAERLLEAFLRLNELNLLERIKNFEFPVLIVSAEEDNIKPKKFSEEIYKHVKNALHLTIPNSGHAVVVEKPKEIGYLISTFVRNWKV
uniref:Alpha/beta hydrolase n=1 Tax=Fervidobacterium pennivorans TaxID=93466 RepID=A0A7V4KFP3_FERPE